MRALVICLFLAVAAAEISDEPWIEEEDVEEPYDDEYMPNDRRKRDVHDDNPFFQHIRVKRLCSQENCQNVRRPRQVHQYEVHELTDEINGPVYPPYEEMLAASADHYQRVYVAPAPANLQYSGDPQARYLHTGTPTVNTLPLSVESVKTVSPVQFIGTVNGGIPAVSSEPVHQPLQQLAGGDLFAAAAGQQNKHAHGNKQGGGHAKHAEHYAGHGGKSTKGHHLDHHVDKGGKGYNLDERHRKEYEEAAGKKKKHHDKADHKGSHEEEAHGQRGSHFDEKKGHKKGHKTKGYHNKYHKDEFHKEHKFYDDFHKSGEHHRYGKFNAKHASNESGKKKAHHVNAGHDFVEQGNKGYSNKGHVDADHKGYKGKHGHEEHHENHTDHGKKGGNSRGKHWGYAKN